MKTRNALMLAAIVAAGGCASITKGTSDTINVEVDGCGEKTECTATNKKGTWMFDAPGPVTVKKSDDGLKLRCVDGDEFATRTVAPDSGGMIWGNAVFGGVIGAAVDSSTDAHWEYPETVTINRRNCPED